MPKFVFPAFSRFLLHDVPPCKTILFFESKREENVGTGKMPVAHMRLIMS